MFVVPCLKQLMRVQGNHDVSSTSAREIPAVSMLPSPCYEDWLLKVEVAIRVIPWLRMLCCLIEGS